MYWQEYWLWRLGVELFKSEDVHPEASWRVEPKSETLFEEKKVVVLSALLWLRSVLMPSLVLQPYWESVFKSHLFSYEIVERHKARIVRRADVAKKWQNVHGKLVKRITKWIAVCQILHQNRRGCLSFVRQDDLAPLVAHGIIQHVWPTRFKFIVSHGRNIKNFDHILNFRDACFIDCAIAHKKFAYITFKPKKFVFVDAKKDCGAFDWMKNGLLFAECLGETTND